MRGAIPPFPQYVFMAWCLLKYRESFFYITVEELDFLCVVTPLFAIGYVMLCYVCNWRRKSSILLDH
jgi:hypothetical protein